MSKMHLVKNVAVHSDGSKTVHFNDGTKPLNIRTHADKTFSAQWSYGRAKSMSMGAVVSAYHTSSNKRTKSHRFTDANRLENRSLNEEVIITKGEHAGKEGIASPDGEQYRINDREGNHICSCDESFFISKQLTEEVNTVGGGAIAGAGVGPQGEPGVHLGARKRNMHDVLDVVLTTMMSRKKPVDIT